MSTSCAKHGDTHMDKLHPCHKVLAVRERQSVSVNSVKRQIIREGFLEEETLGLNLEGRHSLNEEEGKVLLYKGRVWEPLKI